MDESVKIGHPTEKFEEILDVSNRFFIGDREYTFNVSEVIFLLKKPIDPSKYHNTPEGCNTCGEKWRKTSDLEGSNCDFCGISNCKKCMKKTRPFKIDDELDIELDKSGRCVLKRGTICRLCDRKFLIKDMVAGSLDKITM